MADMLMFVYSGILKTNTQKDIQELYKNKIYGLQKIMAQVFPDLPKTANNGQNTNE